MTTLPAHAYLPGIGRVQIIGYPFKDYFRVLDRTDTTRLVHRDRLTFTK